MLGRTITEAILKIKWIGRARDSSPATIAPMAPPILNMVERKAEATVLVSGFMLSPRSDHSVTALMAWAKP
jgi:hypothetical protein